MYSSLERKSLGQVIRVLRELEGLTRAELAEEAELSVDMIAKIEQGAKTPSGSALKRISEALSITSKELTSRSLAWLQVLESNMAGNSALLRTIALGAPLAGRLGARGPAWMSGTAIALGAAASIVQLKDAERAAREKALRATFEERIQAAETAEDFERIQDLLEHPTEP